MPVSSNVHAVPTEVVLDFLGNCLPFNQLPAEDLHRLANQAVIDFFPKGTLIFEQDATEVRHLYLIQKGGVRLFLKDQSGEISLKDFRGEGEYFGALPIIQNTLANLNVETVEDTFCFLIAKEAFVDLIASRPVVAQHYLRSLSDKLVRTAYAELRQHKVMPRTEGSLYLFNAKVGDIVKDRLHTINAEETVQEAAALMSRNHIGSLLVRDQAEEIIGIVTDKDLRTQVVAQGLDYRTPVRQIMTFPVRTIASHAVCFDALLKMMGNRIHHLGVERQGKIVGVITTHDVMVLQGHSPISIFREITAQRRIEDLYPLARRLPQVVRSLIEDGAKANNITRMITLLNDHILDRILGLLTEEMGPAPARFCWLLMGSEGRREQTFKTDQDNALIYANPENDAARKACEDYFKKFSENAIEHLVQCGYPRCPGNMMASNPKWCRPYKTWQGYFDNWIETPEPQEVLHATIFFDFRGSFGDPSLAARLRRHLAERAASRDIFLLYLAKDCLESRPPLSFFRNFIVEKDGEHKNQLDLTSRGLVPFVDFARVMALRHGVQESNTLERLLVLHQAEHLSKELYTETVEAYEFLMQLRLVHQLRLLEEGKPPNNHINPGELTDLEKKALKEAFAVIHRLQNFLRYEFRLDAV